MLQAGEPFPHPRRLGPGPVGNHQGDRSRVLIQEIPAEHRGIVGEVEEESSPLRGVQVAEVEDLLLNPLDPQFTVGERHQGQGAGGGGLGDFAIVHHQDQAGGEVIDRNPGTEAEIHPHPAPCTTFTLLCPDTHIFSHEPLGVHVMFAPPTAGGSWG